MSTTQEVPVSTQVRWLEPEQQSQPQSPYGQQLPEQGGSPYDQPAPPQGGSPYGQEAPGQGGSPYEQQQPEQPSAQDLLEQLFS